MIVLNLISMPEHSSSVEIGHNSDHIFDGHFGMRLCFFYVRPHYACLHYICVVGVLVNKK